MSKTKRNALIERAVSEFFGKFPELAPLDFEKFVVTRVKCAKPYHKIEMYVDGTQYLHIIA